LASIWPGGLDSLDRVVRGNLVPAVAAFENVIRQQVHGVAALGAKRRLVDNDPGDLFDLGSRFAPPPRSRFALRPRHGRYQAAIHLLPDRWCSSWAALAYSGPPLLVVIFNTKAGFCLGRGDE
jgi:hypothetical protein